jgi:ATP-dependent exoDNAse (exonuclease V) beta subunit
VSRRETPEDAQARRRALDPARSFIVQAPAGSGKTGLLIQRYLALLATVDAPEEVVAITFTRKATGEMRGRVLEALDLARGPAPEQAHARLTWELAAAVRARDDEQGWDLHANPARLRIQTIDALCHQLARRMPVLARFGGDAAPADDAEPLYREAARRTLALVEEPGRFADAVAVLLLHLDNDIARFESMLHTMLVRRDQWLRLLTEENVDAAAVRAALQSALERAVDDALGGVRDAISVEDGAEIARLAAFAGKNLVASGRESGLVDCADLQTLPEAATGHLKAWRGLAELLLTSAGGWRKSFNVNVGFPAGRDPLAVEMKARARNLTASLSEDDALGDLFKSARALPDPVYSDDEFSVLMALLEVLRVSTAMLQVVFAERGSVDYIETVNAARLALGDEEAPTDLALALDYRISHLLVDEFQDTSHTHFTILQQLTAGWTPDDGRTLFLVGDPVQSIYRFREADVGVYLNAWHHGMHNVALNNVKLTTNFRSGGGLVGWVNDTFPRVFPPDDDASIGAVAYREAQPWHAPEQPQPVVVHPLLDGDDALEAQCVVACVRECMNEAPQASIAVLVRSRSHLSAVLPALDAAAIAYRGVELRAVLEAPVVHDLLSLTRALMHPADRVAWLAVLRAPWCGLLLADLAALTDGAGDTSLAELITDPKRLAALSRDGRTRLARVAAVLISALKQRGRRGLRRQVEGVWQALGGPALTGAADLADANACLDLIERYEAEQRVVDIDALQKRLADLRLTPAAADARVEVMTIHKAKGLEFDYVVVPGLDRRVRGEERRLLAWTQRVAGESASELLLAPLPRGDETDPAIYAFLNSVEKQKQTLESGRLIYVAATRARRCLHLIGKAARGETLDKGVKAPQKDTLLAQLWPALEKHFIEAAANAVAEAPVSLDSPAAEVAPAAITRLDPSWALAAPATAVSWTPAFVSALGDDDVAAVEFEWAGYGVRHVGIVVHALLKRIADEGVERWDATRVKSLEASVRSTLAAEGLSGAELAGSVEHVLEALTEVVEDSRGRWILSRDHEEAYNELALSGLVDGRLVSVAIDRSFVDDSGTRWIVDYKSGRHEGGDPTAFLDGEQARYAAQLERYARLMSAWDQRPTRVGLYFPLLRGWREWTPAVGGAG